MKIINTARRFKAAGNSALPSFAFLFFVMAAFTASFLFFSCEQDSLFADIAVEPAPREPMIPGALTNMVLAKEEGQMRLFTAGVGAKTIYVYYKSEENASLGKWKTMPSPGGVIISLASDGENLYALSGGHMNASLHKYMGGSWSSITSGEADGFSIQVIYGEGGMVFAGGRSSGGGYAVFSTDGTDGFVSIAQDMSSMLTGAAGLSGVFYLSAGESGVFKWDAAEENAERVTSINGDISGIKNINGDIIAVSRGGSVFKLGAGNKFEAVLTGGPSFTGGMGVWKKCVEVEDVNNPGTTIWQWQDKLLLLGHQTTSTRYNKGYREIPLDASGKLPAQSEWQTPGSRELSSVAIDNESRYEASIARYSVNFIMQVPDEVINFPYNETLGPGNYKNPEAWEPVVFATTANNGLMSLHDGLWNFE